MEVVLLPSFASDFPCELRTHLKAIFFRPRNEGTSIDHFLHLFRTSIGTICKACVILYVLRCIQSDYHKNHKHKNAQTHPDAYLRCIRSHHHENHKHNNDKPTETHIRTNLAMRKNQNARTSWDRGFPHHA